MQHATRTTSRVEQSNTTSDTVLDYLRTRPDGATLMDVADALDLTVANAGGAIARLRGLRLITQTRKPWQSALYSATTSAQVQ